MKIEVDQSNKIEEAGDTFLAFSNSIARAIKIPFAVKQKGLQVLRDRGKPKKRARFLLFAVCVFLLLEGHLNRIQKIVVDNEYDGHQVDVKLFLLEYIRKKIPGFATEKIAVESIGKKSSAHWLALAARKGKKKPDRIVGKQQLLSVLG